MPLFTITGDDTLIIGGQVITDLADNDISVLSFPNNIAEKKTGKNGNTIVAQNQSGLNGDLVVRIMRGSSDDVYLQGLLTSQINNFAGFSLLTGQFVKNMGDGTGTMIQDVYTLTGGFFNKQVEGSTNVQGTTDQGVAIYRLMFSNVTRTQQ